MRSSDSHIIHDCTVDEKKIRMMIKSFNHKEISTVKHGSVMHSDILRVNFNDIDFIRVKIWNSHSLLIDSFQPEKLTGKY